jgi:hypothetical protein
VQELEIGIESRTVRGSGKESRMSAESKKSMGWTIVLMVLGVAALYGGSGWLAILIPAALLVLYGRAPALRNGRN